MADLQGTKVLLVEDEGTVAMLIEDMLEDFGCELVASIARLRPAMELSETAVLDLAILDVNVAGEPSFDFARTLAARGVPFVFSTGYGKAGLPSDLQDRPVLTKPFATSDLYDILRDALEWTVRRP